MEFKKEVVILLGQCVEDISVELNPNGKKVRKLTVCDDVGDKTEKIGQIVTIIDFSNLAVESLYSYEKFMEIFDKHGFSGFVG